MNWLSRNAGWRWLGAAAGVSGWLLGFHAAADPLDTPYWRTFYITPIGGYDLAPGSSNNLFMVRDRLLALTRGAQPANIKVGFSMTANFIASTHGGYYDYVYSPAYAPWETDTNLEMARATGLPLGIHVNGTPWADPPVQSMDVLSNFLEKYGNGALLQVDRFGRIRNAARAQEPTADEVYDGFADMLEMQLTLSRNATLVQDYLGRNARIAMRLLGWYREQHPDLLVFTSTSSEYAQNVAANTEYCDYSEWSKQEFRDWLSGAGLYAGQGQYASLAAFNSAFSGATGFPWPSWDAVQPPTNVNWSTLTANGRWWNKWHEFRIAQVRNMVQQQIQWGFEAGWSPDLLYGHQIPFDPNTTSETERKYASPWTTTFVDHGGNGITTYGSWASSTTIFNAIYANDRNWGIFEWNPMDTDSVANNLAALNTVWNSKAHIVCPYAWYGQPPYQIYGRPIETAIAQFVSNRFNDVFTGLSPWETTAAARDLIWTMTATADIEATSGTSALIVTNSIATGWTSNTAPWLTLAFNESPTRHIVADAFHAISFRLRVDAAGAGPAYVGWQDTNGVVTSLLFVVKPGWNVYRLNVAEHAAWRERRIQRLRLQPCAAAGVGFALDWFRLEANRCWHFDDANEIYSPNQLTNLTVGAGQVSAISGPDGYFYLATDKRDPAQDADRAVIDADYYKVLRVRMTAAAPGSAQVYWWKRGSSHFYTSFPVAAGTQTYEVDLSTVPDWSGVVTRFRLDPVNAAGVAVSVDYVSLSPRLLPPRIANSDMIVNSSQPVFLWDAALEPDHPGITCDLELATDFFFTNVVYATNGLTGGRHVYAGPLRDGLHWWRVRARSAAGAVSPWAVPMPMFLRVWEMNLDGDLAYTNQVSGVTLSNGIWQGSSSGNDPYLEFNSGGNLDRGINAEVYKRFRCRVKVGPAGSPNAAQVFYFPKSGGFVFNNITLHADGQWRDVEVDFTGQPQWQGYIRAVRIDPTTFSGAAIAVDSAEMLPGPDPLGVGGFWGFNTNGNFEGWQVTAPAVVSNGLCSLTFTGAVGYLQIVPLWRRAPALFEVRLRNLTPATTARLYWGTETGTTIDPARSVAIPIPANDPEFHTFVLDLSTNAFWAGQVLAWLGFVPAEGATNGAVDIDFISLTGEPNQPPSFTKGPNVTVLEDAGPQTFPNWATAISPGPPAESWQTVSFICSNSNPALFSAPPAISSAGTLTFTSATNANGTATVTVWARDDGGTVGGGQDTSAPQTFTITVTPVNDPPSFTKGPDITVNQNAGPQTFPNWATNIDRGAPDEAGQAVSFTVTNSNNALFSVQPAISSVGTLTFTPATNAVGTATVGVRLVDSGGTANGGQNASPWQTFFITIQPVNRPPVAGADAVFAHANFTTPFPTALLLANDSDPDGDPLSITGVTPGTNTAAVTLATNAVLFTPLTNFTGAAGFSYLVSDGQGGAATGAVTVSVIQPRITGWLLLSNGAIRVQFAGLPTNAYVFQTSSNLANWWTLSTNQTDGTGWMELEDVVQPAPERRFFRFQSP